MHSMLHKLYSGIHIFWFSVEIGENHNLLK